MTLADSIQEYLLTRGDWVPAQEICLRFGVRERQLRALDEEPGLCSGFAISGNAGFKHVALATSAEWLRAKHRLRRHGIRELVRVRDLDRRRQAITRQAHGMTWAADGRQAVMVI